MAVPTRVPNFTLRLGPPFEKARLRKSTMIRDFVQFVQCPYLTILFFQYLMARRLNQENQ